MKDITSTQAIAILLVCIPLLWLIVGSTGSLGLGLPSEVHVGIWIIGTVWEALGLFLLLAGRSDKKPITV